MIRDIREFCVFVLEEFMDATDRFFFWLGL